MYKEFDFNSLQFDLDRLTIEVEPLNFDFLNSLPYDFEQLKIDLHAMSINIQNIYSDCQLIK